MTGTFFLKTCIAAVFAVGPGLAGADPSLERGEYLVTGPAGCGNCHTPFGAAGPDRSRDLGGRLVEDNEAFTAYAPNITPAGRIADWTDEELVRAIREGLRPDDSLIGPPMPFALYRGLSDDDVHSIVAYLRTVPAVENEVPKSVYNIPLPPVYGPPITGIPHPEEGVTVEYGEYLAGPVAHCMECHTPHGPQGPMLDTHPGAGGFEFHGPWGISVGSNLTPHPQAGIAHYSDDELKAIITTGQRPDGTPMTPPMPYAYLANMTDNDLDAIILYLRSLKPLPYPG